MKPVANRRRTLAARDPVCCDVLTSSFGGPALPGTKGYLRPITIVIEPGPFVNRSGASAAMESTRAFLRLLLLARRIEGRALQAGKIDDQPIIVRHPSLVDLDSILFQGRGSIAPERRQLIRIRAGLIPHLIVPQRLQQVAIQPCALQICNAVEWAD